jgi:predicted AlkP superfamily phosphohydrolase/phosphomutase
MPETIVLGLDGANWNLLEPWLDEGALPNIESLRDGGVATDMQSCLPPVTCPNWRCYSTGKNPGKLGVYWWERIDTEERTLSTPNSRTFASADFWDYLNDDGRSVGVVNLPMTYPPFDVDGFMVAGGPGSEQDDYTSPSALAEELDDAGYRVHPEQPVNSDRDDQAAAGIVDLVDDRLDTFRELVAERDPDVAHCTVFYINVLQHFYWRDEVTRRAWIRIDEHVGAIREEYPEATLVLMSDHGCKDVDTVFFVNSWLERAGHLATDRSVDDLLGRLGVNKKRVSSLAHDLGVHGLITSLTPGWVERLVPDDETGAKREQKLEKVRWSETDAIASGQGLVYTVGDDDRFRDELTDQLAELESEVTGDPVARRVYHREDIYEGPYLDDAPEIVFDQTPGVHTTDAIGDNPVFSSAGHWRAENVRTGLFLADGPDVSAEEPLDASVSITDVMPTVLHSVGSPIPSDVDGDVLSIFDGQDPSYREPIERQSGAGRSGEAVEDRLEDLGYLR